MIECISIYYSLCFGSSIPSDGCRRSEIKCIRRFRAPSATLFASVSLWQCCAMVFWFGVFLYDVFQLLELLKVRENECPDLNRKKGFGASPYPFRFWRTADAPGYVDSNLVRIFTWIYQIRIQIIVGDQTEVFQFKGERNNDYKWENWIKKKLGTKWRTKSIKKESL